MCLSFDVSATPKLCSTSSVASASGDEPFPETANVTLVATIKHCDDSLSAAEDLSLVLVLPYYLQLNDEFEFESPSEDTQCEWDASSYRVSCFGVFNLFDTLTLIFDLGILKDKMPIQSRNYLAETSLCLDYLQINRSLISNYPADYRFYQKCDSASFLINRSPEECKEVIDISTYEECQLEASSQISRDRSASKAYLRNKQPGWQSNTWGGEQFLRIGLKAEYKVTGMRLRVEDNVECFYIQHSLTRGTLWTLYVKPDGTSVFFVNQSSTVQVDEFSAHYFQFVDLQTRFLAIHVTEYSGNSNAATMRLDFLGCSMTNPLPMTGT